MKPLLHIVSSNRLLIAAFSDHGEIVQVFHQARVALEGEHHPGPLALSIGHIPPSEGRRLGGSFRQHAHLITHPLAPCREATSTAQETAVRRWRQAPHQARTRQELLSETANPRGARSSNGPASFPGARDQCGVDAGVQRKAAPRYVGRDAPDQLPSPNDCWKFSFAIVSLTGKLTHRHLVMGSKTYDVSRSFAK